MRFLSVISLSLFIVGCRAESPADVYGELAKSGKLTDAGLQVLSRDWTVSHVPMALEVLRFEQSRNNRRSLFALLEEKSGQSFGHDMGRWQKWLWQQSYTADPDYSRFKSSLYKQIDPRFADYFDDSPATKIRLDEVVWGGVLQDGIPPLRDSKMISAPKATYLADSDVVFGIEVKGEARAYPKRILAWHEMFTDTIKGVPLAGVY